MADKEEHPPLTIRLVNTTDTNWIMEGTENSPDPIRMNFPGLYRIIPTSKMKRSLDGKTGLVETRHIFGCDSIDPVVQDRDKRVPNIDQDNIYLVNGAMTFLRVGATIGTYDFIKTYQGNKNNPLRPDEADVEFEEVIAQEIALENVTTYDRHMEAMLVMLQVRKLDGGEFTYDLEKLGQLATLLDVDQTGSDDETYQVLFDIALKQPQRIVETTTNPLRKVMLEVKKAEDLGVILFEEMRAVYTRKEDGVLISFKDKRNKKNQVNKLAEMLTQPDKVAVLEKLRLRIAEYEVLATEALK